MKCSRLSTAVVLFVLAAHAGAEAPSGAKALEDGMAHLAASRWDDASKSFEAAFTAGYMPHEAAFGAAEAAARKGDTTAASEWLTKAGTSGFRDYERVRQGAAFAPLLASAEFESQLEGLERRAHPCRAQEYRALDFWIGDWVVIDARTGSPAGRNRIEPDMDGCVIVENWTGRTGWTGRSFNVYRREAGTWRQTWTDSAGQLYDFDGSPSENTMVYTREMKTAEGTPRTIRITLKKAGDGISHRSERSDDGGKTWAINYDFVYRRE